MSPHWLSVVHSGAAPPPPAELVLLLLPPVLVTVLDEPPPVPLPPVPAEGSNWLKSCVQAMGTMAEAAIKERAKMAVRRKGYLQVFAQPRRAKEELAPMVTPSRRSSARMRYAPGPCGS